MTIHLLSPGFQKTSSDAALSFRAILDAMSRPGKVLRAPVILPAVDGFNQVSAMIALTLCDHETPVRLDPAFDPAVAEYIRFHCGSPIVAGEAEAAFAFFHSCPDRLQLEALAVGTPEYPDASATAIIQVSGFEAQHQVRLAGPGIKGSTWLQVEGVKADFWTWWRANNVAFPLGVDVIFTAPHAVVALPRTTRLLEHSACT